MTGELHHDIVEDENTISRAVPVQSNPEGATSLDLSRTPTVASKPHEKSRPDLYQVHSTISHHDIQGIPSHSSSFIEVNAAQYERFSNRRKVLITCVLSLCGFLAPISSTTILAAIPEVAATYDSTGTIINLSNALYLIFMGI